MRLLACLSLAALALAGGCGGGDAELRGPVVDRVVGCGNVILKERSGTEDGYRVLLRGAVSVPPSHLPQTFRTRERTWPYWEKAGLLVRAGRGPVDIAVAPSARARAAIGWGNPAHPVSSLEIAACPGHGWNAYAGGFFLKHRSDCVPLTLRAGDRTATVTVGLRVRSCAQP